MKCKIYNPFKKSLKDTKKTNPIKTKKTPPKNSARSWQNIYRTEKIYNDCIMEINMSYIHNYTQIIIHAC